MGMKMFMVMTRRGMIGLGDIWEISFSAFDDAISIYGHLFWRQEENSDEKSS